MSQKNQFRFLVCFLFSILAHSSVLVASFFFTQAIAEEPQGAIVKAAAGSSAIQAMNSPTLHSVELTDIKTSQHSIPDSVQVAELAQKLPEKSPDKFRALAKNDIILAKADDPTAVEIEKPIPQALPVVAPAKTIAETKKSHVKKKPSHLAKAALPKKEVSKPITSENLKDDTIVAQAEELTPVKDRVDAQAKDEVAVEATLAPITETHTKEAPAPAESTPIQVSKAAEEEENTRVEEAAPTPSKLAKPIAKSNSTHGDARALKAKGEGDLAESVGAGSAQASSPGGAPEGVRDGDSLVELTGNIRPLYPVEDRRAKREGTAVFIARITHDGRVQEIKLESPATAAMNAAALKAFGSYHYKAGQEGWVRKKFVFKITGEAEEPARLRRTSKNDSTSR